MSCQFPVVSYRPDNPSPTGDRLFDRSGRLGFHNKTNGLSEVQQAMVGHTKVGRVRSTGHDISVLVEDQITVLAPLQGSVTCEVQNTTFRAGPNEVLVFSPNPRQTRVQAPVTGNFEAIVLLFSMRDVQQNTEKLDGSYLTRKNLDNFGLTLSSGKASQSNQLSQLARLLVAEFDPGMPAISKNSGQSWSQLLTEKLVSILDISSVIDLPQVPGQEVPQRHVFRAEDYMHEHFAEITTAADIANVCDISVRSLEMAFKLVKSQSPMARLAEIRLAHARRLLCGGRGAESVTQAALDSGFNHLGRFSQAYKRRFGETPSATMRGR